LFANQLSVLLEQSFSSPSLSNHFELEYLLSILKN
jgi:hypothetical protein